MVNIHQLVHKIACLEKQIKDRFYFETNGSTYLNTASGASFVLRYAGTDIYNIYKNGIVVTEDNLFDIIIQTKTVPLSGTVRSFTFRKEANNQDYRFFDWNGTDARDWWKVATQSNRLELANTIFANHSGNVGIGTTTPSEKLTIGGGGKLRFNRSDNGAGHTIYYDGLNDLMFYNGNGGDFLFNSNTNASIAKFRSNGNLLLGSNTDSGEKLQVNGNVKVTGRLQTTVGVGAYFQENQFSLYGSNYLHTVAANGASTFESLNTLPFTWSARRYVFRGDYASQSSVSSTGVDNIFSITPIIVQSGIAGYTSLLVNTTETSTGSGTKNLLDLQIGGSSRFSVSNAGGVTINSTTTGFLPPRMTATQRTAIASPAVGLIVYQTDGTEGVYVYKSSGWVFAF